MSASIVFGLGVLAQPALAATITVSAGGNLQAALNQAQPGDTIVLQAGATFTGNFILPVKSGSTYITVRSSAPDSSLPGPNQRITPAYASLLPKIRAINTVAALATARGAHHWRLQFLEIQASTYTYNLVQLGDADETSDALIPREFIIDRVLIRGHPTEGTRRGIALNSKWTRIANSYIDRCADENADSQAIMGWTGPGPYFIENNYLEGAGENLLFGGGDPRIPNLTPSDIVIRGNHFFKPRSWQVGHPSFAGRHWVIKNLLELKHAQRVLIEGNLFENSWVQGQDGPGIALFPTSAGTAPWTKVRDITFRHNIVRKTEGSGVVVTKDWVSPVEHPTNLVFENNLFVDIGGWFVQMSASPENVRIEHNTVVNLGGGAAVMLLDPQPGHGGFVMRNNLVPHRSFGVMGGGFGTAALDATFRRPHVFQRNMLPGLAQSGFSTADYPASNGVSDHGTMAQYAQAFMDAASGNYRLRAGTVFKAVRATDGTDVGVNMDTLEAAQRRNPPGAPSAPTGVGVRVGS